MALSPSTFSLPHSNFTPDYDSDDVFDFPPPFFSQPSTPTRSTYSSPSLRQYFSSTTKTLSLTRNSNNNNNNNNLIAKGRSLERLPRLPNTLSPSMFNLHRSHSSSHFNAGTKKRRPRSCNPSPPPSPTYLSPPPAQRREIKNCTLMKKKDREEDDDDAIPIQRSRARRYGTVENLFPSFHDTLKLPSPNNTLKSHSSSLVEGRRSYWDDDDDDDQPTIRIRSRRYGVVENMPFNLRSGQSTPSGARSLSPVPPCLSQYLQSLSPSHHILDTEGKTRPISVVITDHSVPNKNPFKGSYSEIDKMGFNDGNESDNSEDSNLSNLSSPSHQGRDDNSMVAFHLSDVSDEVFGDEGEGATAASSSSIILRPQSSRLPSPRGSQFKSSPHKSDYALNQRQEKMNNSLSQSLLSILSPRMGRRNTSALSQSPKASVSASQSIKKKIKSWKKGSK